MTACGKLCRYRWMISPPIPRYTRASLRQVGVSSLTPLLVGNGERSPFSRGGHTHTHCLFKIKCTNMQHGNAGPKAPFASNTNFGQAWLHPSFPSGHGTNFRLARSNLCFSRDNAIDPACRTKKVTESTGRSYLKTKN